MFSAAFSKRCEVPFEMLQLLLSFLRKKSQCSTLLKSVGFLYIKSEIVISASPTVMTHILPSSHLMKRLELHLGSESWVGGVRRHGDLFRSHYCF